MCTTMTGLLLRNLHEVTRVRKPVLNTIHPHGGYPKPLIFLYIPVILLIEEILHHLRYLKS